LTKSEAEQRILLSRFCTVFPWCRVQHWHCGDTTQLDELDRPLAQWNTILDCHSFEFLWSMGIVRSIVAHQMSYFYKGWQILQRMLVPVGWAIGCRLQILSR
jgi:hypothetical protein